MKLQISKLREDAKIPIYMTPNSAGADIFACIDSPILLKPLERQLIPTGIALSIPNGYEAQIRPRSGLSIKHGITVLNSPGTIDSDYRGEIKIILINLSSENFTINNHDRIAQMVIAKVESVNFEEVELLDSTSRGEGGFGSTGTN